MTSASSIKKPWSSDAVRQGASPTAQATSVTTPHDRHTTWWWLSLTRPSNRAGLPAGSIRRTSPATASASRASYTVCRETWPMRSRTPDAIASTPRWSPSRTVSRSATRAAVKLRPATRSSLAVAGVRDAVMAPSYLQNTYVPRRRIAQVKCRTAARPASRAGGHADRWPRAWESVWHVCPGAPARASWPSSAPAWLPGGCAEIRMLALSALATLPAKARAVVVLRHCCLCRRHTDYADLGIMPTSDEKPPAWTGRAAAGGQAVWRERGQFFGSWRAEPARRLPCTARKPRPHDPTGGPTADREDPLPVR